MVNAYKIILRCTWKDIFRWFWLFSFFVVVWGPLVALGTNLMQSLLTEKADYLRLTLAILHRRTLLFNSLGLAVSVAASSLVVGVVSGSILWRRQTKFGKCLRWTVLILAPIPPYIHALVWSVSIFYINFLLNKIGSASFIPPAWINCWWVQFMSMIPFAIGITWVGLETVNSDFIDAARMMRSDINVLIKVILPLAAPMLIAGGGLLFLLSIMDSSVPQLFGMRTYLMVTSAEFYRGRSHSTEMIYMSLPILFIGLCVISVSHSFFKNLAQGSSWRLSVWKSRPVWPGWFMWLQWATVLILVAYITIPLLTMVNTVGTWENFFSTVALSRRSITLTAWTTSLTVIFSIPMALIVAEELKRSKKWKKKLWWILVTVPLAVPPMLIGLGLIVVWNRPIFTDIYGSGLMYVLAKTARFTPIATIILLSQLRHSDSLLFDAAKIIQTNPLRTWLQIKLPMLTPGILIAIFITFALTLVDIDAALFVTPPGPLELPKKIYSLLHYGASGMVAALCLVMIFAIIAAGFLAVAGLFGYSLFFQKTNSKTS